MKKFLCLILSVLLMLTLFSCKRDEEAEETGEEATEAVEDNGGETPSGDKTEVDLILFAGGANMSGRGNGDAGVACEEGHAYEFKAVSDPTKLYPMTHKFGAEENLEYKIDDTGAKTGGMVPAFCESYYKATNTPVVAISCSDGNNPSAQWTAGKGKLEDAITRLQTAQEWFAESDEYAIRHTYLVWLQGEADGDASIKTSDYQKNVGIVSTTMQRFGVEQTFVIMIGNSTEYEAEYRVIQEAQRDMCGKDGMTLISDMLPTLDVFLKNGYLYSQSVYDIVGANAGTNAARYVQDPSNYQAPNNPEYTGSGTGSYSGPSVELPVDPF